jgi:HlyD family secretion protein
MKTKLAVALFVVVAACAAVLGWSKKSPGAVQANSNQQLTSRARRLDLPQEMKIRTEMNGKIREMRVEEGDRVQRGQVIAILENSDSTARAAQAEAALAQREAQLHRLSGKSPSSPESEEVRQAKAEVDEARTQVAQARAILLKTFIRSPIDGVLLRKRAKPGEQVSATNPDGWIVAIRPG